MHPLIYRQPLVIPEPMPSASNRGPPAGPPLRFEASKGPWIFSTWVEVDGEPMPVYHIEFTEDGPEAWIPVPEGKVGAFVPIMTRGNPY